MDELVLKIEALLPQPPEPNVAQELADRYGPIGYDLLKAGVSADELVTLEPNPLLNSPLTQSLLAVTLQNGGTPQQFLQKMERWREQMACSRDLRNITAKLTDYFGRG